jgi:two-component system OmpR family sensor kinase
MKQVSIQHALNRWIILTALIFTGVAGLFSSRIVFLEAAEEQDELLQGLAILVKNGQLVQETYNLTITETEAGEIEEETIILIQALNKKSPKDILSFPHPIENGFHSLVQAGQEWRILVVTQHKTQHQFAVAQTTELRDELAWVSVLNVFLPILVLIGLMLIIINLIIRYQFQPLHRLANILQHQDVLQLQDLAQKDVPQEVLPLVASLNMLLERIRKTLRKQQRFITDASHELRTPITAFSLLLENLDTASTQPERQLRQQQLKHSLERVTLLVNQLLNLARLQSEQQNPKQRVSFLEIIQNVIADLHPIAESAHIDLGMLRQEAIQVMDQDGQLKQLVYNAIDNAIRYTPEQGCVDVSLYREDNDAIFCVADTGVGIPEAEITRVMEPFYRVYGQKSSGSNGLGLAISQEIAQRLDGQIHLKNRPKYGLVFTYRQVAQ